MSFIEVQGLGDDYEDKPVPEGEYTVRVNNIEERTAKDGVSPQIMVMCNVEDNDYPNSATIFYYLTFPSDQDDDEKRRTKMRMNTRFLTKFNVPFEKKGFNAEDIVGCSATCLLKQEEYEGAIKNAIVLPAVAD
jgi:hypothetical protein